MCVCISHSAVSPQAPLSMGFSRQEYWSGLPFPPPGDHPNPGTEPTSPVSPALQADSLPTKPLGKPLVHLHQEKKRMYISYQYSKLPSSGHRPSSFSPSWLLWIHQSLRATENRIPSPELWSHNNYKMAPHSSVPAWRIPGTGQPGGLPSMGSHRVGQDWSDLAAAAATTSTSRYFPWPNNSWRRHYSVQCFSPYH